MTELKFVTPFGTLYAHSFVLKQTAAGGGNAKASIRIPTGTHAEIMSIAIGPNDYAADRDVKAWVTDENNALVKSIMHEVTLDNMRIEGPGLAVMADDTENTSAATISTLGLPNPKYRMGGGDILVFQGSSFAQNEEMTVILRLWVIGRADQITVDTTGSTGTVTLTNTSPFPKVI